MVQIEEWLSTMRVLHPNTRSFLCTDDLCIATQKQLFEEV